MQTSLTKADPSWSIKVSIAAQKFAHCITDCKGSDTTWELRMRWIITPNFCLNQPGLQQLDNMH